MRTLHWRALCGALLSALGLSGCPSPDPPGPSDLAPAREFVATVPGWTQRDVDILFLIDNSPSMSEKQQALAAAIPRFIQKIDAAGANYQIGVATSDVGSWTARDTPWSLPLGTCNSFAGDDGVLQRVACNARTGVSQDAVAACQALCPDPRFVPEGGAGYIRKINGVTNVPKVLENGVDVGPQRAFQCLALVGDNGCGIEGPLEGARRALDGHNPLNAGFLRAGSQFALVLLTDEDDCSVSLAGRRENNPLTRDCAAPDQGASYDCFNPDYRCLARSTECNEPLNTPGAKSGCRERPQSYLEPVETYATFFSLLRPPSKLLISGIYTRPSLASGGKLVVDYERASNTSPDLNRATGMNAGCVSVTDPKLFARPQHRLSKFTQRFAGAIEADVCDTAGYPAVLDAIADAIKARVSLACLPAVPKQITVDGRPVPACVVGDVPAQSPESAPATTFPVCSAPCCDAWAATREPAADEPGIKAACASDPSGAASACYCVVSSTASAPCPATLPVAGIIRKGGSAAAPPGTVVSFRCQR